MFTFKDRLAKVVERAAAACKLTGSQTLTVISDGGYLCLVTENERVTATVKIGRHHTLDVPRPSKPLQVSLRRLQAIEKTLTSLQAYEVKYSNAYDAFVIQGVEEGSELLILTEGAVKPPRASTPQRQLHIFGVCEELPTLNAWQPIQPLVDGLRAALTAASQEMTITISSVADAGVGYTRLWEIQVADADGVFLAQRLPVYATLPHPLVLDRPALTFLVKALLTAKDSQYLKVGVFGEAHGFVLETECGSLAVTDPVTDPVLPNEWLDGGFRHIRYDGTHYECAYGQVSGSLTVFEAERKTRCFNVFFYLRDLEDLQALKEKAAHDKSWIAYAVFLNAAARRLDAPALDVQRALMDAIQKGYRFGFYDGVLLAVREGRVLTAQALSELQKAVLPVYPPPEDREE